MLSNNNYRRSSDYGRSRGGRDDPADASLAGRASSSSMARGEGSAALPTVKLVLVGDQSVGKSSLIARYTRGDFAGDTVATVGVEFFSKIVSVGGGHGDVRVQVWDTAGQERHRSLTKQVFRGARGVMIVYDITNRASFEALPMWLSEIKAEVHATCCFMLVGNKYDLVADASSAGGGGGGGYDNNGYDSRDRDRGGGRGYASHHGSGRSQPPSPSNNSNYYNPETPKSNGHFNNNNNNNFYPNANARHPPIPLSPSSASSTRGRSPPMPPLHRHQRSNSFQKYAFTSGGSGSTPTSNSQCTTPSNRREEGGRERERVRGERRGGYDDDCRSLGGSDRSRHNYDGMGSTTSSGAYRYPNESSGHRAPPPDLGQTQRYVFTSGGRGTTRDDGGHGPPTPSSNSRGGGGGRGGDHYQQQQPRPKGMAGAARGLISGRPRSRQVNLREADEFARANGMSFLETSAKDHTNVERAFTWIVQNVMESSASFVPPSRGGGGYMYENEGRGGGGGGAYNNNNYNPYRGGGGGGEGYYRNSVNLSGKDRPRRGGPKGAGEGYSAAANDSDDDSRDGRSRCPC